METFLQDFLQIRVFYVIFHALSGDKNFNNLSGKVQFILWNLLYTSFSHKIYQLFWHASQDLSALQLLYKIQFKRNFR